MRSQSINILERANQMRCGEIHFGTDLLQLEGTCAVLSDELCRSRETRRFFVRQHCFWAQNLLHRHHENDGGTMFSHMLRLRIDQYLKEAIQASVQLGLPTRRGRI